MHGSRFWQIFAIGAVKGFHDVLEIRGFLVRSRNEQFRSNFPVLNTVPEVCTSTLYCTWAHSVHQVALERCFIKKRISARRVFAALAHLSRDFCIGIWACSGI